MLNINLVFDASAQAAPQSFRDAVEAGANVLEAAIYDPITVNIAVGYGEISGPDARQLTDESYGGPASGITVSYPALRAALLDNATTDAETSAISALPNTASLEGQSTFAVSSAQAKALGAIASTDSMVDGYTGYPTSFSGSTLESAAIVEDAHALGLSIGSETNSLFPLSLVSYSGAGQLSFTQPSGTAAYFSTNGGVSNLADYDVGFDPTLFDNQSEDPLDAPDTGVITLTPLDLTELSTVGFDTSSTPVLPTPNAVPTMTSSGTSFVTTDQSVSVARDGSVPALSFIQSVTVPSGDTIGSYGFYDQGNGHGGFSLDGVREPAGQWIYVLDTQLSTLTYVGGSVSGNETISAVALGSEPDSSSQYNTVSATTTSAFAPVDDFYGDGTSDILFQNTNGTVDTWEMNGATVLNSTSIANPGTSWHEAGAGDFNADGYSDILYQNDDGTVAIWELNGSNVILGETVANPGTSWHVIGTGDFDENGTSDILFQNNDGTVEVWNMNGTSVSSSAVVASPGAQWHAIGTGDFFGTGQSDILLQNDDGTIDIWQMSGDTLVNGTVIANPGPTWHAVGAGDFNGDGKSDILFQNNDGSIAIWEMNGTTVTSGVVVANPGPSWHAVSTGDYNGDGKSDILLQNDNGTVEIWQMNGTTVTAGTVVANPGTQWQTTGQGSMHFINGTESMGAVSGTILADDFVFTTSLQGAHTINGFDPVHDVITLNQTQFPNYAAVQAAETTVNGSTVITLGTNDTLTINGILPGSLAAKNFV